MTVGGENDVLKLGPGFRYKIYIQTGDVLGAGTDSNVAVCIVGQNKKTTSFWSVFILFSLILRTFKALTKL